MLLAVSGAARGLQLLHVGIIGTHCAVSGGREGRHASLAGRQSRSEHDLLSPGLDQSLGRHLANPDRGRGGGHRFAGTRTEWAVAWHVGTGWKRRVDRRVGLLGPASQADLVLTGSHHSDVPVASGRRLVQRLADQRLVPGCRPASDPVVAGQPGRILPIVAQVDGGLLSERRLQLGPPALVEGLQPGDQVRVGLRPRRSLARGPA